MFSCLRLSSFVIDVFRQADDYIAVEDVKIAQTMKWIISNQAANGSFSEPPMGRVIHTDMQVLSCMVILELIYFTRIEEPNK